MRSKFTRAKGTYTQSTQPHMQFDNITDVEMLKRARELLRGRWTQGSNALNAFGLPTSPTDDHAVNFCLRGACIHVLQPAHNVLAVDLHVDTSYISKKITNALGFESSPRLVQWNDSQDRTEEQVIEHINHRIKSIKDKGRKHVKLPQHVG